MNNYQKVISLGYICNNCHLTDDKKNFKTKRCVFDNIEDNFENFLLPENIEKRKIFEDSDKEYWMDKKYYIRFLMGDKDNERFKESMDKRVAHFLSEIANTDQPILFLRFQEKEAYSDKGSRIIFDEYKSKYEKDEYHYLKLLSNTLKTKYPDLTFKILFMNDTPNFVDVENNIVGIETPDIDYRDRKIIRKMKDLIDSHKEFLDQNL